jgi:glycogen(starch) synthase
MRVLMFGWEFPPHMSGGLGTACFGITEALTGLGHEVLFVMPRRAGKGESLHATLISSSDVPVVTESMDPVRRGPMGGHEGKTLAGLTIGLIDSILRPYLAESQYESMLLSLRTGLPPEWEKRTHGLLDIPGEYGPNLLAEVFRYAEAAGAIARAHPCDVIHCHDWMTVFAGIHARKVSGRPLIFHVHALEWDRSGENINQEIYEMERIGMESSDHIIAVSHYTRNTIGHRYGINPDRVSVVHNAVSSGQKALVYRSRKERDRKVVLFLGRITFQKGPDYFIEAAAQVLAKLPDVTFIMAGSGYMMPRMIERVAELGLGKNFHFTGFLKGAEIERIFSMSDLYVMPSVSEPFGISPLEAMMYGVPVIISKQSGVAEILKHALTVNFWDVRELADKMIAVLKYPALAGELARRSREEIRNVRWENAAVKIIDVYHCMLH